MTDRVLAAKDFDMRSSFDITLAEIKAAYSPRWSRQEAVVKADPAIVEYSKTHSKRDCYLYNNRIYFMYLNPSEQRKSEYTANRNFINKMVEHLGVPQ